MKELEAAAIANGVKPGAQMSRFLLWVGNECYEGREQPDLKLLADRAKILAERFLAQDGKSATPTTGKTIGMKTGVSVSVLSEPVPQCGKCGAPLEGSEICSKCAA